MANRDQNLLFGIMAVLLKRVTPDQLVEAAACWASDPSESLANRMESLGILNEKDRAFLEDVVARAVAVHGGDTAKTLDSFGGMPQVAESFGGVVEPEGLNEMRTVRQSISMEPLPALSIDPESVLAVDESPGRYEPVGEHARGAMGRVLLVQDGSLNRQVALKELLPDLRDDGAPASPSERYMHLLSRFLQEARITGQLEHPSIVPVYELGRRSDGTLYYTMKLVRGRTFREALNAARGLRERLALLPHVIDLCQALAYAHNQRIIHRDIKPANIMIGEFGETVVLDWGLAKSLDKVDAHAAELAETMQLLQAGEPAAAAATAYGEVIGTPAYMPPEQARGELDKIDERSDIYALGAILYEVLTGQAPFTGETALDILPKVVTQVPVPVAHAEPGAPPELAAIAMRAMAKDPADRYASAKEMAGDIAAFQSGALVGAHDYSAWDHLTRFARQHKAVLTTGAAAAVVILAVVSAGYLRILGERDRALTAESSLEVVAEFQSRMLAEVNPEEMGLALRENLLTEFAAMLTRLGMPDDAARERLRQVQLQFMDVDFTGPAVQVLDSQIFARAITAAERDYDDQPLVQARLFQTIAMARANLGIHDGTAELQQRAIANFAIHLGHDSPGTHEARANLGIVLWHLGRHDEGITALEAAVSDLQRHWPPEDPRIVGYRYVVAQLKREGPMTPARVLSVSSLESLLMRGSALTMLSGVGNGPGWAMAAGDLIELALAMMAEDGAPLDGELVSLLPTLRAGEWVDTTEAQRDELVQVVEWIVAQLPGTAPFSVGSTLPVLANEFLAFGDLDGAEDLQRRALHWFRGRYGSNHPRTLAATDALVSVFVASGKWADAEGMAVENLERHLALHGAGNPNTRTAFERVIELYDAWNRADPGAGHDAKAAIWRERSAAPALEATLEEG